MKLSKSPLSIKEEKSFPGLLSATFEHKVSETNGELKWDGPPISPEVWFQVMSFFQWTYDTTKSESQVRLFVDPEEKKWLAWAFPQEAKTGMTAHEMPGSKADEQRAALPNSARLILMGTIHHHCACSAFQSGTDQSNEEGQDGLHITVGRMDEKCRDMHVRFYVKGYKFDVDMAAFWDVGETVKASIPRNLWDTVARYQMNRKVESAFPDQWKENLIEVKPSHSTNVQYWDHRQSSGFGYSSPTVLSKINMSRFEREAEALEAWIKSCFENDIKAEHIKALVNDLFHERAMDLLTQVCSQWEVNEMEIVTQCYHDLATIVTDIQKGDGVKGNGKGRKKNKGNNVPTAIPGDKVVREGWIATHTISGVPVRWDNENKMWENPGGMYWSFELQSWVKVRKPDSPAQIPQTTPSHGDTNEKDEYWDVDQQKWVTQGKQ